MEGNGNDIQVAARRFWNTVRGMLLVLRKNISKKKRLTTFDFDIIFKRGKLAGKNIIHNLAFHNHNHNNIRNDEYEFSCSNTPARVFPFPFHLAGKRNKTNNSNFFACAHAPETVDDHVMVSTPAMAAFLRSPMVMDALYANSPALPGFGRTPLARQLRVTDSPYPIHDLEESYHVDKAAEEFIVKFYQHLRKQQDNSMAKTERNF